MQRNELQQLRNELAQFKSQLALQSQRADNAERAYDYLLFQYKQLARQQFGDRSERYTDPEHPQHLLFDELADHPADEPDAGDTIGVTSHQRLVALLARHHAG